MKRGAEGFYFIILNMHWVFLGLSAALIIGIYTKTIEFSGALLGYVCTIPSELTARI